MQLAQVVPLTGAGARRGNAWRNGVEFAVQAINAGVEPRFQVYTYDSGAAPVGGKSSLQRALDGEVAAVLAVLPAAAVQTVLERGVPLIVPGTSWMPGAGPGPMLASPSPLAGLRRFLPWLRGNLGWRRFAVLGGPADGERPWRDAFRRAAGPAGLEVVADLSVPVRAAPGGEVGALLRERPDAVFLDAAPAECARLLQVLRVQAPDLPVAGAGVLADPAFLEAAGPAARALTAHVSAAAEVPAFAEFSTRFEAAFKAPPGVLTIDGYIAAMMVRAGLARVSRGEAPGLAAALRGLRTGADETLLATRWSDSGEPERETFVARIAEPGDVEWLTLAA